MANGVLAMNPTELERHLRESEPLLLDVREPWEFEICRIEGSVNLPMSQLAQRVDEVPQQGEVVVICHHGIRSAQVIRFLQAQTAANLVNLDGGVDAWAREIDPAMPVY